MCQNIHEKSSQSDQHSTWTNFCQPLWEVSQVQGTHYCHGTSLPQFTSMCLGFFQDNAFAPNPYLLSQTTEFLNKIEDTRKPWKASSLGLNNQNLASVAHICFLIVPAFAVHQLWQPHERKQGKKNEAILALCVHYFFKVVVKISNLSQISRIILKKKIVNKLYQLHNQQIYINHWHL